MNLYSIFSLTAFLTQLTTSSTSSFVNFADNGNETVLSEIYSAFGKSPLLYQKVSA